MEEKVDYQALWVRLNRPSPERFQAALKKRGIPAPGVAFLREHFFRWQSSKQLFALGRNTSATSTLPT